MPYATIRTNGSITDQRYTFAMADLVRLAVSNNITVHPDKVTVDDRDQRTFSKEGSTGTAYERFVQMAQFIQAMQGWKSNGERPDGLDMLVFELTNHKVTSGPSERPDSGVTIVVLAVEYLLNREIMTFSDPELAASDLADMVAGMR